MRAKKAGQPRFGYVEPFQIAQSRCNATERSDRIPTGPAIRTPDPFMRTVSTRIGSSNDAPVMT